MEIRLTVLAVVGFLSVSLAASAEKIPYKNSGNPWIDNGPIFFDTAEPGDSRSELQVGQANYVLKQVLYWTRYSFKKAHWEKLVKVQPLMANPYLDLRKPILHHVDCTTLKVNHLQYNFDPELPPLRTPTEDPLEGGKLACKSAGIPTPNKTTD